jgi:DNA-binding HxlR family transcriptional regulator
MAEHVEHGFCPRFHAAVELIGGRWTGAIIRTLLNGRSRYAAIRATIPQISDRMLSARLRELEAEAILRRIVTPDTPVRVEYELTKKGRALSEAVAAIATWAEAWTEAKDVARKVRSQKSEVRSEPRAKGRKAS